jgi:hypothetical protein
VIRFLVLLVAAAFSLPAQAWWDCSFNKRVALNVTNNSTSAMVNPQIELVLGGADGAAVPGYVWSRQDSDLRVVDQNDSTVLPIWTESRAAATTTTRVWVSLTGTIAAGATRTIYAYYDNSTAISVSNINAVIATNAMLYHSRNSSADPTSLASWKSAWVLLNDNTSGYACRQPTTLAGLSNRNMVTGGSNSNILFRLEVFFFVSATQTGTWRFRMAGDFGRGGGLYVNDNPLQETWNADLWWGGNWANTAQILQGNVSLNSGWHVLRAWGAEGCCDGAGGFQIQLPGSTTWLDANTTNLTVRNGSCNRILVGFGASEAAIDSPVFRMTKTSTALSDPISGTTNPVRIPGSQVQYSISVAQTSGRTPDANSLTIDDQLPVNTKMCGLAGANTGVTLSQGAIASNLTLGTVSYSNNGGATYTYTKAPDAAGCDANITNVRVSMAGTMSCKTAAGEPTFKLDLLTVVK